MERKNQQQVTRRRFLLNSAIAGGGIIAADLLSKSGLAQVSAPAIVTSDKMRPKIPYGKSGNFENFANGDGPPLGRELELADLLRFIKKNKIRNVVWLTADVHYAAAHYYDPVDTPRRERTRILSSTSQLAR